MKKSLLSVLSAALCVMMVFAFAFPTLADNNGWQPISPYDLAKLTDFWYQEAYAPGVTNGDAVYEAADDIMAQDPIMNWWSPGEYGGSWYTELVELGGINYQEGINTLKFYYYLWGTDKIYDEEHDSWICVDAYLDVKPDLYGKLDLSGTSILYLGSPDENQTHITSVNFDDCPNLHTLHFSDQLYCTELTAVNCPNLDDIEAKNCAYNTIKVQPIGYDEPVEVMAFGDGAVGLDYNAGAATACTLYAYNNEKDTFLGWYVGGELVSSELDYVYTGTGKVTACFGGDANDDGIINMSDAVTTMRASMALQAAASNLNVDIDCNGTIDVSDAVLIARLSLDI